MIPRARAEALLDAAAPAVVAAAVVAAAAGFAPQVPAVYRFGTSARWAMLAVLFVFAVARFLAAGGRVPVARRTTVLLAVFCGLSLASAGWSVHARGTVERAVAQPVVAAALVLLAGCSVLRPALGGRLLDGVLIAAAAVALAGFVYWLVDPVQAAIPATVEYASRYRGIEGSPDTGPLLFTIAMPIALWRGLAASRPALRALHLLLLLGFAVSISASGSRGALAAGFLALAVVAVLAPLSRRGRLVVVALVVAGLAVAAWGTTLAKPLSRPPAAAAARAAAAGPHDAERVLPLTQEIGNPWWTHRRGDVRRSLFNTSVRMRALVGTAERALGRPLLGYGFGAEQWAFVNRYYAFSSENPENGYAGILLQLGLVGLVLWLAFLVSCVVSGVRACVRSGGRHPFAVGAVGAAAGALSMALSQSFFHGPGGIAYVAFWAVLLLSAAASLTVPAGRPAE